MKPIELRPNTQMEKVPNNAGSMDERSSDETTIVLDNRDTGKNDDKLLQNENQPTAEVQRKQLDATECEGKTKLEENIIPSEQKIDNSRAVGDVFSKMADGATHMDNKETENSEKSTTAVPDWILQTAEVETERTGEKQTYNNEFNGRDSESEDEEPSNWSSGDDSYRTSEHSGESWTDSVPSPPAARSPYTSLDDMIFFKLVQADTAQDGEKVSISGSHSEKVIGLHDGENELSPLDIISLEVDQWYRANQKL